MGCNCKKNYKKISKVADGIYGGERNIQSKMTFTGVLNTIYLAVTQFLFGLVATSILLVFVVPLLVYVIVCILLGKEPSVRIPNMIQRMQRKKVVS